MKKILTAILSVAMACGIGAAAVGCAGGDVTSGSINVYNRESTSGTRAAFLELLGIEETDLIKGAGELSSTGAVLTAVAGDSRGIGYISLGSLDSTVKALTIDGVEPSVENVKDGSYAIARPFELIYSQENYESNDLLRDFIAFLKSSEAQEIISDYGYVSIYEETEEYTAPTEQFETTTLDIGGSTSVQPLMGIDDTDKGVDALVTAYKEACGQDVTINVSGGGSSVGISNAANGTLDIGMASKEVTQSDFTDPQGTMVIWQLCSDGIAVIVNTQNAVSELSKDDLIDIYTGKVTDWSAYNEATGEDSAAA